MQHRVYLAILATLTTIGAPSAALAGKPPQRLTGPLIFAHDEGGYVGIATDGQVEAHALSAHPLATIKDVLATPSLAYVTLPAEGREGQVIDQKGRCLSNDAIASTPTWLPCSSRFTGQTWRHTAGTLASVDADAGRQGRLGFWPGMDERALLTIEGGDTTMTLLVSQFKAASVR
jgi:hypothetical protein